MKYKEASEKLLKKHIKAYRALAIVERIEQELMNYTGDDKADINYKFHLLDLLDQDLLDYLDKEKDLIRYFKNKINNSSDNYEFINQVYEDAKG